MARELFCVCREVSNRWPPRWIVRKGLDIYGEYLSESAAVMDAVEAAQDSGCRGDEAHVLVIDELGRCRIEWSSVATGPAFPPALAASLLSEAGQKLPA